MHRGLSVAVVVPAFNEERLLGRTLASVPGWVDALLVVDDGSADGTAAEARRVAGDRAGFELLAHPDNQGVGAAIATGYRRCLELGVDVAVVMGADAQMDPADLPTLLTPLALGEADYAKGDRLHWPGVRQVMPPARWVGNWGLTLLTRAVSGYWRMSDSQCGYTAVCRRTLRRLPLSELYPRYGYPNDLLARLHALGARVVDVPVRPVYGSEESGISELRIIPSMLHLLGRSLVRRLHAESAERTAAPGSPAWPDGEPPSQ